MPKVEIQGIFNDFEGQVLENWRTTFGKVCVSSFKGIWYYFSVFHKSTIIFNLKIAKEKALQKSSPCPQI